MRERARQVVTANVADAKTVLQQLLELEAQIEAASAMKAVAKGQGGWWGRNQKSHKLSG